MKISSSDFDNGGEVDLMANYKESGRLGRLSIRRASDGLYEIYVKYHSPFHLPHNERIITRGDLKAIVMVSNQMAHLDDEAI